MHLATSRAGDGKVQVQVCIPALCSWSTQLLCLRLTWKLHLRLSWTIGMCHEFWRSTSKQCCSAEACYCGTSMMVYTRGRPEVLLSRPHRIQRLSVCPPAEACGCLLHALKRQRDAIWASFHEAGSFFSGDRGLLRHDGYNRH